MDYEKEYGIESDKVIYHGIPVEKFGFKGEKQDYMFWLGGFYPRKGADLAVKVAKKTKRPLILAGNIFPDLESYFNEQISPYLTEDFRGSNGREEFLRSINSGQRILEDGEIIYVGTVNDPEKTILFQNAFCFLLPNRPSHNEPFGLVMAESMATGTPVIAPNFGSPSEVIRSGTGKVIDYRWENKEAREIDEDGFVMDISEALREVYRIDPFECRRNVEERFSRQTMARIYLDFYGSIMKGQ